MSEDVQAMSKISVGRIGITLELYPSSEQVVQNHTGFYFEKSYHCLINGRGFSIVKRIHQEGKEDQYQQFNLCSFDSFLYPDQITEEEVNLVLMMEEGQWTQDESVLYLCSYLVALWQGGADEMDIHNAVDRCVAGW